MTYFKHCTDPAYYELSSRTKLEQIDDNHIGVIKLIKSRIIAKDAIKIVEMAESIRSKDATLSISLICTSNICSKSIRLLEDNQIGIITRSLKY